MGRLVASDFAAVRDAVAALERRTRGEVVPLVIDVTDDYGWVRERGALAGFVVGLALVELYGALRPWPVDAREFVLFTIGGAVIGFASAYAPGLARLLAGTTRLAANTRRRALAEFTARGCSETRERTGILVMVALFERRIEILADRGIQAVAVEREGADVWDRVCADFSREAGSGRAIEGLIRTIERLGDVLARHFPARADDANELSDELRTESSDD